MKFEIVKYTDVWAGDYPGTWQVNNVMRLDGNFEIAGDPDDSEIIEFLIKNKLLAAEYAENVVVNDTCDGFIEIEMEDGFPIMHLFILEY